MQLTILQLIAMMPEVKQLRLQQLLPYFNSTFTKYDINTVNRVAMFLAQSAHESGTFNILSENLNYSPVALCKTFGKYFPTLDSTSGYARNPEKIANKVYANRMGNGDEASGDGWKFRGKGAIQITGRTQVQLYSASVGKTLDDTIAYLDTLEGAIDSAGWYWNTNHLNDWADKDDNTSCSKMINVGHVIGVPDSAVNGLADRTFRYMNYKKVLAKGG